MRKKLAGIFVCILLVMTIVPISGSTNNTDESIFLMIEQTYHKTLDTDGVIGDVYVRYWNHVIDDVVVKNDFILLHTDIEDDTILSYEKSWTDIDFDLPVCKDFEPRNIFWKQLVVFPDEDDCTYFYTFNDIQDYPLVCWEVRHDDGTTIMYNADGEQIGQGIPTPSDGFSMSGYNDASWPDPWLLQRESADSWFRKWCISTTSISLPSLSDISLYVSNPMVGYFYELAHGGEDKFQAEFMESYYTATILKQDMANRQAMKFAFIGSCHGMTTTGPFTFSHEFRKGQMTDTVTIGFDHMEICSGWTYEIPWQDYMFEKIDDGFAFKEAFDMATAQYPSIEPAVVFVGDEDLKLINPPTIDGPILGAPSIIHSFSVLPSATNDAPVSYLIDWGDGTPTDWIGPYTDDEVTISHSWSEGEYEIKIKAKYAVGRESDYSSFELRILTDDESPSINIISPQDGYLYLSGEQKLKTLLGRTIIIGEISLDIDVSDDTLIDKVDLFINSNLVQTYYFYNDGDSFSWDWDEQGFGKYNLKVVADDWAGNTDTYELDVWKFF